MSDESSERNVRASARLQERNLLAGDRLYLYTDGVIEALDASEQEFAYEQDDRRHFLDTRWLR